MHDEHRVAFTDHRVFHGAEGGLDRLAAAGKTGARTSKVARKDRVDIRCGSREDYENGKENLAHVVVISALVMPGRIRERRR